METITITYALIWEISFKPNYKLTKCGKLFNCKNGREVKQVYNGGSIGYWIDRKFYTIQIINMEKSKVPTSEYSVACDHFDTFAKLKIHETDDGRKLKMSVESESESSDEPLSISLFKEDVEMMIAFMSATLPNLVERP